MIRKQFVLPVLSLALAMSAPGQAQPAAENAPTVETNARSILSAFMSYTDLRIQSVQRTVQILASTSEAKSGEWERMKDLLEGYQASDEGLIVWFARPDGTYYTAGQGLMEKKLNDRSYFPDLTKGRKVTGALVVSKATGQRSAIIAVPVTVGDQVIGAIGVSLFLDKLSDQISGALDLGPDVAFFALAPDGLTTLHRKTDRHFLDPRELGSETLKKAASEMLSGTSGKTTYEYDEVEKHAIYRTSPLTGWRFAIAFSAGAGPS